MHELCRPSAGAASRGSAARRRAKSKLLRPSRLNPPMRSSSRRGSGLPDADCFSVAWKIENMACYRQAGDRLFYVDSFRLSRGVNYRSADSACDCCTVNWYFPMG